MSSDQLKNTEKHVKAPRSVLKTIIFLILGVVLCALLFLSLLPTILTSSWGKQRIEAGINSQIPGSVQIGKMSLGWFGPQDFYDVVLKSPEGKNILTLSRMSTSASIYSLWNRSRPNSLEIEDLNAAMEIEPSGVTNFERALSKNCCSPSAAAADPVNIELKNTNLKLDLSGATDSLRATLAGKTVRNALQGEFAVNAELSGIDSIKGSHLVNGQMQLTPGSKFNLNADITHFPVALIDQLIAFERPEAAGILSQLLGEELNGTVHQIATDQGMSFDLNASSSNLAANFLLEANEKLTLKKPAKIELHVTPQLVDKLAAMTNTGIKWKLNSPTNLQLTIDRFSSPLGKSFSELNLQDLELAANLLLKDAVISGDKTVSTLDLHNFQASVNMSPGSKTAHVTLTGDALHDNHPLRVNIDATVEKPIHLKDLTEKLRKQLTANILVEGDLSQAIDSFFATNNLLLNSIGHTTTFSAVVAMVDGKPVSTTSLNASAVQFSDLVLKFDGPSLQGGKTVFSFNMPARDPSKSPLAGSLAVRGFSLDTDALPKKLKAHISIDEFTLNDASRQIRHAINGTFSTDLILADKSNKTTKGSVALDLRNDLISGKASFDINNAITLKQGSTDGNFVLNLTPDNFPLLRSLFNIGSGQADLSLQEPANVKLDLKQLYIPLQGNTPLFQQAAINSILTIPRLSLASSTARQSVILSDIQANIESSNISNQLAFSTKASGGRGYTDEDGKQAGLSLNGTVAQILTAEGEFDPNMSVTMNGTAEGVPVPLLCELLCNDPKMNKKVQALLGSRLNAQLKMQLQQMNGPIYLAVNGSNGNFLIDGNVSNGRLKLNRNFEASVAVTPELGKYVLSDYIPVLGDILSAENPIKLTIGQQDFDFPINNPTLEQITIGQASLELGKLYFANTGALGKSLKLLAPSNANFLSVWLTPAYFTLSQGALGLQRVDMLISDRYPVAAWGNVDFFRDRVNMMLGLSGAAINKAFGVSGVQNKYMLQLPLRGTLKDASIDKSKVAARLSAIVAQSHGGPQGLVLGTILDVASGGLTEEAPPQPTTNPLPWANQYEDPEATDSTNTTPEEQSKSSKNKNPLKQIGKDATNILKEIFR